MHILSRSSPEVADKLFMVEPKEQIDWQSALSRLSIPVLMIHGERDPFYDVRNFEYLQSLLPGSRLRVFEGSGHLPAMTRPAEVAGEIDRFFAP